jgi:hypothetical protein
MYVSVHIKYPLSYQILMKLEFSRETFEKYCNIKFMKIHPLGAALFHKDGQTDRHDEANSCSSQFCERAWKWPGTLMWTKHITFRQARPQVLSLLNRAAIFFRPRSYKASWNLTDRFNFTEERFDSTHAAESTPAKKNPHIAFLKDVRRLYYLYTSPSISTDVSFIRDSKEVPCV